MQLTPVVLFGESQESDTTEAMQHAGAVRHSLGRGRKGKTTSTGGRLSLFSQGGATVSLTTRLRVRGIREASYLKGGLWTRQGKH